MSRPARSAAQAGAAAPLTYALAAAGGSVWLGLGWTSLGGLAVTVVVTVALLLAGLPVAVGLPFFAAGCAMATLPVAGRPLLTWLPRYLALQLARLRRTDRWNRPLHDILTRPRGQAPVGSSALSPAQRLGIGPRRLRLTGLPATGTNLSAGVHAGMPEEGLGLISHGRAQRDDGQSAGRHTLVLEVIGLGRFGLLDPADQDTELARWGTCLATLCADPAAKGVQWLTHARPDCATRHHAAPTADVDRHSCSHDDANYATDDEPTDEPTDEAADEAADRTRRPCECGDPDCLVLSAPDCGELDDDYLALIERCAGSATRHRHLLAVTLTVPLQPIPRAASRGDAPAGRHRDDPRVRAARDIATTLLAADLLARPLGPAELGDVIRYQLDPTFDPTDQQDGRSDDPARWVPLSTRSGWDQCRTDDAVHRCFVVTGWPRLALTANWLSPLLQEAPLAGSSRTLSIHARPVAPEHATRRARAASTKARLDAQDRSRMGFTPTIGGSPGVADALAESDALAAEEELVAGYRMTDLSALFTVSAINEQTLHDACRQLRGLATAHRIELRPLHGQHLTALASALPLGVHPGATT